MMSADFQARNIQKPYAQAIGCSGQRYRMDAGDYYALKCNWPPIGILIYSRKPAGTDPEADLPAVCEEEKE